MKLQFKQWKCLVIPRYYNNNRRALVLVSDSDHEPIITATVNLCDCFLHESDVFIKDYYEGEGMTDTLIKADIIHPNPTNTIRSGFVDISSYKLTETGLNLFK